MRDTVSIDRVAKLHPKIREEVKALIEKAEAGFPEGWKIRVVQGLRTIEEQNALYAQGRTKPGPVVTKAKGGSSYHNYSLAIDFCLMYNEKELSWDIKADKDKDGTPDWNEVVKVFEDAGYEWGGKWSSIKDYPHIQKTFGYTWRQLLALYNAKKFLPGSTVYLDI